MTRSRAGSLKLIHLITSLDVGGAEMMLYRLLKHIDRGHFENQVICMIPPGAVREKIQALGIPVISLEMQSGSPSLDALFRMTRLLRGERPDILHTWMYHADLLGGLAGFLSGTPVIWGIHNWSLDPNMVKRSTIKVVRMNARLSRWIPRKIIICSDKTRDQHITYHYAPDKFITIPNGFDLENFTPDASMRGSFRKELGLDPDAFLIGMVARFDPLKDYRNFTQAAGLFLKQHPQAHFLLCGKDITWENKALSQWIDDAGPRLNFHLLGQQDDIPRFMNALDVNTLSSSGEAFPSVLGEAMACGVPCVATDVGDTAYLIGDSGFTVPPKDPQALSGGWGRLLEMSGAERAALGERARQRIEQYFSITQITRRYEALYQQIVNR
jgi:glycosyltransferase involved in cell wall biosynthesis